jgi:hypothetical protein
VVLGEVGPLRVDDEGVALVAVGRGEGPVDGDREAAPLQRRLAGLQLHRDVAVDDERLLLRHAELGGDLPAEGGLVDPMKIGVLGLLVGGLVREEVALEGGHLVLAKEGRTGPCPEVVEPVQVRRLAPPEGPPHNNVEGVEERLAAPQLAIDKELQGAPLRVDGDAAVEHHQLVPHRVGGASLHHEPHVLPEPAAVEEGALHPVQAPGLRLAQPVGVRRVEGWKGPI